MAKTGRTTGLASSALVAAVSLAVLSLMWHFRWPAGNMHTRLVHGAAGLSLFWALVGWATTLISARLAGAGRPHAGFREYVGVVRIAVLALALLAFIPMLYQAVLESILRSISSLVFHLFGPEIKADVWSTGWCDLLLLAGAIVVMRVQSRERRLNTVLFWLAVFAGLWLALCTPQVRTVEVEGFSVQEVGLRWSGVFMGLAAVAVGGFTFASGYARYRRRLSAWPDDLWKLTTPLPEWPGFRYSVGVVGVAVLALGLVNVTLWWTPLAGAVAGASMLVLAGRKWEENLADVGLALITMSVVALVMLGRPADISESAHFAEIINRALIGLAIMAAFWHWLADVWVQQLDDGEAWTTAGRLIRPTRRVGYLVAAAGLLVSMNLAMWPLLHYAGPDNSAWRWAWGLSADGLLVAALAFATVRTRKPTLGWLWLLAVGSTAGFALTRMRGSAVEVWWANCWPVALTLAAAVGIVLANVVHKRAAWQGFWEALYLSGILVLPMLAIAGTAAIEQLRLPHWVPAATFACLAGVYLLAAWLPGPRGFAIAGVICGAVSVYMRYF